MNRGVQVLLVAGHLVEAHVGVSVLADHVRLDIVFAVIAPAGIAQRSRIRRGIRHARPNITSGRQTVFHFVVHKVFEAVDGATIGGVGVEMLHETFEHGPQVGGGIRPIAVGDHFVGRGINSETTIKIGQPLALELILENRPLSQEIGRVRICDGIGKGPGQQLPFSVELHRAPGDLGCIDGRKDRETVLCFRHCRQHRKSE